MVHELERGGGAQVPKTFAAKSVLITGGSRGIGAALARAFANAGASVMITGRDRGRGQGVVEEIRNAGGVADFVAADLAHPGACETVVERTRHHFGALHVLVNNAAVHHRFGTLETGDAHWLETMTVNVNAVFFLSRAAANAMKAGGGGSIVNIASQLGLYAHAGKVSYCASKAAVIHMTRAMALDLAPHGIRVNAVCAGITRTEMLERGIHESGETVDAGLRRMGARTPLGRVAIPDDIAGAVLFLASDAASYVTGTSLSADGGNAASGPGAGADPLDG